MKKILIALSSALLMASASFAQSALDVMKISSTLEVPLFSQTQIVMEMIGKSGKVEQTRQILQFGNHKNGLTQTVFDFRSPADVKDQRILQVEKANKTEEKTIYMPSLGTTRKVNVTEKKKSFFQSDFSYNDMTIRKVEDDQHEMLNANASCPSNSRQYACWQIKSTPVANKDVEFAYRVIFVEKETYLPLRTEFYDKTGKLTKSITTDAFTNRAGATGRKYNVRDIQTCTNHVTGHATRVTVKNQILDKEVSDKIFTQSWLTTGKF